MVDDGERPDVGFVLVHGSELGAWLWDDLLGQLDRPAVAVDLPGRGSRPAPARSATVSGAVDAIVEDAGRCDAERVVLVGHSFSGVLLPPAVAALGDRVAAVVFLGAAVPEEGRSWAGLLPGPPRMLLRLMYRLRPDGMLSPEKQNRTMLCHDLDEETTAAFLARRVPEPPGHLLGGVSPAALPQGLPAHYVRLTDDLSMAPAVREAMIARLPDARVHDLASGHLPMLSQPAELAALLERIASAPADRTGA